VGNRVNLVPHDALLPSLAYARSPYQLLTECASLINICLHLIKVNDWVQLGFEAHEVTPTVCPCHLFFPSCHRLSQRKSTEAQPKQQQLTACRALHALTACRALLLQRPSRNITSHTIMVCQGCFHRLLFIFPMQLRGVAGRT
jgi:hypothetical protein